MNRFVKILVDRFGSDKPAAPKKTLWQTAAYQKARLNAHKQKATKQPPPKRPPLEKPAATPEANYSSDIGGRIADGGPGKNVLIRDTRVREDTDTYETLTIVDDNLLGQIEEDGIDPYNTGRFDRSKPWDSARSRK
ncbi:MAG: hypothetical protein HOI35_01925 [Woeseia sp.]|jgi:hypothetical protein|nr:hypothetical protein [Woeseia sp.]MBT6208766.1 hypothetical protein [Woeseia sp.]